MSPSNDRTNERARIDMELARARRLDAYLPLIIGAITTSLVLRVVTAVLPLILERMH